MLQCFQEKRSTDALINGALIIEKADELPKICNKSANFNTSKGWLCRWQQKNNLKLKKSHGESAFADDLAVDE